MSRQTMLVVAAALVLGCVYWGAAPVAAWFDGDEVDERTTQWQLLETSGFVPGVDEPIRLGDVDGAMCLIHGDACAYDLADWDDRDFGPAATVASFALGDYAVTLVSRPLYSESVLVGDLVFQRVAARQPSTDSGGTANDARELVLGVEPLSDFVCLAEGPMGWEKGRRQVVAIPVEHPGPNGFRVYKASSPVTIKVATPEALAHCTELMLEADGALSGPTSLG